MIKALFLSIMFASAMMFGATAGYASSADVVVVGAGQTQTVDVFSNCRRVTNPTGGAIAVFKNTVTEWNSLIASPGALTLATCDCTLGPIGSVCSDGAVYAGEHDGNRMYVANADQSGTFNWKTSNTGTPNTTNFDDGLANTNAMIAAGAAIHGAAQSCRSRGASWYLPAIEELNTIYLNADELSNANLPTSSVYYRTSTEKDDDDRGAWVLPFDNGVTTYGPKTALLPVRCVRR